MGGIGSGRQGGAPCTDSMHKLDVRAINRAGLLTPGRCCSWQWSRGPETVASINLRVESDSVLLNYRNRSPHHHGGKWEPMSYAVRLAWSPCGFGGRRAWWLCPAVGCGRRVAVLYGGRVFACRPCHRLAYRSQRETDDDLATRRADTLRRRLGWVPGLLNEPGDKPKGMHWRTYWRMYARFNDAQNMALAGLGARIAVLCRRDGDR